MSKCLPRRGKPVASAAHIILRSDAKLEQSLLEEFRHRNPIAIPNCASLVLISVGLHVLSR